MSQGSRFWWWFAEVVKHDAEASSSMQTLKPSILALWLERPPDGLPLFQDWFTIAHDIYHQGFEGWRETIEVALVDEDILGKPATFGCLVPTKGMSRSFVLMFGVMYSFLKMKEDMSAAECLDFKRLAMALLQLLASFFQKVHLNFRIWWFWVSCKLLINGQQFLLHKQQVPIVHTDCNNLTSRKTCKALSFLAASFWSFVFARNCDWCFCTLFFAHDSAKNRMQIMQMFFASICSFGSYLLQILQPAFFGPLQITSRAMSCSFKLFACARNMPQWMLISCRFLAGFLQVSSGSHAFAVLLHVSLCTMSGGNNNDKCFLQHPFDFHADHWLLAAFFRSYVPAWKELFLVASFLIGCI